MLDRSTRAIETKKQGLQAEEKKLIAEMAAVKVMAKDLIRTRYQITKFYALKSQLQGVGGEDLQAHMRFRCIHKEGVMNRQFRSKVVCGCTIRKMAQMVLPSCMFMGLKRSNKSFHIEEWSGTLSAGNARFSRPSDSDISHNAVVPHLQQQLGVATKESIHPPTKDE
ncbi:vacuolar protein sorting-associated protein 2 [Musa troglodytarum]|uniref:Vacuolar protein sorting-associated protein 2 n=1 Tax=Musa troglodytarum TaxID=320322 RepID=A0A9E7JN31_9LILI|nr:vacuolar protein sorting-associated protein 2 [Musa troglodytarum]